jgi:glucan 1,3-beta-glucosidase
VESRRRWPVVVPVLVVLPCLTGLVASVIILNDVYNSPLFVPTTPAARTRRSSAFLHRGVNLGGWLILEPWITPSMFYPFLCVGGTCPSDQPPVIDERSFCERLGATEARSRLEAMRNAWVTESTFAEVAASGLNTVRIPFGYWIFGDTDLCPGVSSIHHLDDGVRWAEAHSLKVVLDLHGVPPTQNGMDHSGT